MGHHRPMKRSDWFYESQNAPMPRWDISAAPEV
jgi:hypothetical protein